MALPDLNLLVTLDVLLAEGNVTRAARRLHLSASAMSRALARLRETTGDPLLVRAGRALVPTPRALELRDKVGQLVQEAEAVLRPAQGPDLRQLVRTFTLRTSEGFAENFAPGLIARIAAQAPGVRLRFVQKLDKDSALLREGAIDLETGVVAKSVGPEVRAQALFRDRFVGVVRAGHGLCRGTITPARYAAGEAHRHFAPGSADGAHRPGRPGAGPGARHRHHRRRVSPQRWRWRARQTWSPVFPNAIPGACVPACSRLYCRCPPPSSRCPCSGTRGFRPIRPTGGCVAWCWRPALRADGLPCRGRPVCERTGRSGPGADRARLGG